MNSTPFTNNFDLKEFAENTKSSYYREFNSLALQVNSGQMTSQEYRAEKSLAEACFKVDMMLIKEYKIYKATYNRLTTLRSWAKNGPTVLQGIKDAESALFNC
jgi:hypothetical protein